MSGFHRVDLATKARLSVRLCIFDAESLFQIRLVGLLTTCSEFVVSYGLLRL